MPERPDLRQIAENIREALGDYDKTALAEILAYVFKEYVVQSPPPLLLHQTERIEDLEGLSFAELITTLQTRLDVPELAAFQVQGEQVLVRAGGVLTPIDAGDPRAQAAPPPPSAPAQAAEAASGGPTETAPSASRASANEAAARGRADLAGRPPQVVQPPPPRPGGLRVSGTPTTQNPPSPQEPTPSTPEQPKGPESDSKREPADDDDAAVRFSLLELD